MYSHKGLDLGHTWWSSGFPYFLQFQCQFGNKEFMIWATLSSWSCFCWLYIASPSLAAKNIISLISVDHLVMSICRVFSWVVGRRCLLWPVHSLGKTVSLWPASFCTPRPNLPVIPGKRKQEGIGGQTHWNHTHRKLVNVIILGPQPCLTQWN